MDFELAKKAALDEFYRLHPRGITPDWVDSCVTVGGTKGHDGTWIIDFTVNPKIQLRENEFWEIRGGRKVLAIIDPKTGQKRMVIHRSVSEPVVLFRASVSAVIDSVHVEIDSDFSNMDGDLYERITGY